MIEVKMPALSDAMTHGKLLCFLVVEGQKVTKGQPVAEVEADKANIELEAPEDGLVAKIVADVGQTIPVKGVLMQIDPTNEK